MLDFHLFLTKLPCACFARGMFSAERRFFVVVLTQA